MMGFVVEWTPFGKMTGFETFQTNIVYNGRTCQGAIGTSNIVTRILFFRKTVVKTDLAEFFLRIKWHIVLPTPLDQWVHINFLMMIGIF